MMVDNWKHGGFTGFFYQNFFFSLYVQNIVGEVCKSLLAKKINQKYR